MKTTRTPRSLANFFLRDFGSAMRAAILAVVAASGAGHAADAAGTPADSDAWRAIRLSGPLYMEATITRENGSFSGNRGVGFVRLGFSIEQAGPPEDRLFRLMVHRLDGYYNVAGEEGPPGIPEEAVHGTVYPFTVADDGTITFDFSGDDPDRHHHNTMSVLKSDFLKYIFLPLPDDFRAEEGFAWGEENRTDTPTNFASHPKLTRWRVTDVIGAITGRPQAIVQGYVKDEQEREDAGEGGDPPSFSDRRVILYLDRHLGVVTRMSAVRAYEYAATGDERLDVPAKYDVERLTVFRVPRAHFEEPHGPLEPDRPWLDEEGAGASEGGR